MDIYDQRAADAAESGASPEAQNAGARVARRFKIDGLSDPAYIANVVEAELGRSRDADKDPSQTQSDREFLAWLRKEENRRHLGGRGKVPVGQIRGLTAEDAVQATGFELPAKVGPHEARAARTAAIRLLVSYSTVLRAIPTGDDTGEDFDEAERLGDLVEEIAAAFAGPSGHVRAALQKIQTYRRHAGLPELDTRDWTDDDILTEAGRLKSEGRVSNPALKRKLMR